MSRVIHFELSTTNPEQTLQFYSKVFGWEFKQFDPNYWLVYTGANGEEGIDGAIMRASDGQASTINTIQVVSVDEFSKTIVESGGKVTSEKMEIPGVGHFAYCQDPTGLTFGIIEFNKQEG